jgi:hypothetical protein
LGTDIWKKHAPSILALQTKSVVSSEKLIRATLDGVVTKKTRIRIVIEVELKKKKRNLARFEPRLSTNHRAVLVL